VKILKKIGGWILDLCVIVGLVCIFSVSYQFGYGAFANEPAGNNENYKVDMVISEGETPEEVADQLFAKNLISNPKQFLFRLRFSEYNGKLKAGTYEINPLMGNDDILKTMTQMEDTK
jgi:UPF0755 protein